MRKLLMLSFFFFLGSIIGLFFDEDTGAVIAQNKKDLWSGDWERKVTGATGANEVISDIDQNVYVIGQDENDSPAGMVVVKYNKKGIELWRQVYVEAFSQTSAQAIRFDNMGNVVVTGFGYGLGHVVTVSYTPQGIFRWANSFGSPGYPYINPTDLATDNMGNSFVTGSITPTGTIDSYDVFLVKIDKSGVLIWDRYYNGSDNKLDIALRVRVNTQGDVYLGGVTTTDTDSQNFLTLKFDKTGNFQWARTYNGPDNFSDQITDMEIASKGDVIVTGYSYSGRATLRYDGNGNQLWARVQAGPYNSEHSLALDKSEAALISSSIGTYDGIEITRYDKFGTSVWVKSYLNATTIERDIQVDENQNCYVLGAVLGSGLELPAALVLIYDKSGNKLFSDSHTFSNADIVVRELVISCGGNFYFGAWDDFGQSDIITVRYRANSKNDYVMKCKHGKGNKHGHMREDVTEDEPVDLSAGILEVWPNPITENAQIHFVNPSESEFSLELYNIYGARVKVIWQGHLATGQTLAIPFSNNDLVPGMYLFRGKSSGGERYSRKVLVQ